MAVYISLLRGINVSGHKPVRMDALKRTYENLGFGSVTTYVQSGNVVFTGDETDPKLLEGKISARIKEDFSFEVPVVVLTVDKLSRIIDGNPFPKEPDRDENFLHVTFLSSAPDSRAFRVIEEKRRNGEEIVFRDDAAYLYCPNGYGRTKLTNNFLETKLKTAATTRNWKTANELLRICLKISLIN